jgi:GPH family glycoside/pentoside/hexuronide:cation symporter
MAENRLTIRQKLGFGIFDFGGNMLFTLMGFWCLKYLTDSAALSAALAGAAVMIGKLWDAVTDPMMGFISDRTRSRWGRRRPYLLFGAVPMFLALWYFFSSPSISSPALLALWATLSLMAVNTASTVLNIPYSSLTPELTRDYHEQTSLNGYRFGCAVFGTIIGAAAVQPIVGVFTAGKTGGEFFAAQRTGFSALGFILGFICMAVSLLTFLGTKEQIHSREDFPTKGFFATYKTVFANKPYVILFLAYALHLMGITFLQTVLAYYTNYIYPEEFLPLLGDLPVIGGMIRGAPPQAIRDTLTTFSMLLMLLFAMFFIPVSVVVSKKIGKKLTYQICFVIIASAGLAVSAVGHLLHPGAFLCLLMYGGIGVGFSYVSPFAMVPETIEYDAIKTGERKEGAYYGMWTFISKVGQALAVFVSGLVLSWGGYAANAAQGPGARLAIRILIGPLPAFILIGAIVLIQFYPLNEKTYKELLNRVAAPKEFQE